MLAYPPLHHKDPAMPCIPRLSPLRRKRSAIHERTASEHIARPQSIASAPQSMQHTKRASIYVSDASIILSQQRNTIISPTTSSTASFESLLAPSNDSTDLSDSTPDHYAILSVPPTASLDEIRAAFRRLRSVYFSTDATLYRALQTAFDVLADPGARATYDACLAAQVARTRASALASLTEVLESEPDHDHDQDTWKHERKDSAIGDAHERSSNDDCCALEQTRVEEVECGARDANWGLKHHLRLYEPAFGTEPYWSCVPILEAYGRGERHPRLRCRRPGYTRWMAKYSMPR